MARLEGETKMLREWLEQIHIDQLRQFETDVLAFEDDAVDVDELDVMLAEERAFLAVFRDALLEDTHALFVAHGFA